MLIIISYHKTTAISKGLFLDDFMSCIFCIVYVLCLVFFTRKSKKKQKRSQSSSSSSTAPEEEHESTGERFNTVLRECVGPAEQELGRGGFVCLLYCLCTQALCCIDAIYTKWQYCLCCSSSGYGEEAGTKLIFSNTIKIRTAVKTNTGFPKMRNGIQNTWLTKARNFPRYV